MENLFMTDPRSFLTSFVGAAIGVSAALYVSPALSQTKIGSLAGTTHFHGIAVDPDDSSRLFLATHHGLFVVSAENGNAVLVSDRTDDFMGFTPHPDDSKTLYASGHPRGGGNLGVIVSRDGGTTWSQLASGVGGPVDFHAMDVSRANPGVIYGVHGGLQRSDDGGRSWRLIGPAPDGLIDLAASAIDTDTLYAATRHGLLKTVDGGLSWSNAHPLRSPATLVQTAADGQVYAFLVGQGLFRAGEPALAWQSVTDAFKDRYILHLAAAPGATETLYVVSVDANTNAQALFASYDGGARWTQLGAD